MKFILTGTNQYWWPVKVQMPDRNNPGKFITYELEVLFEPESQDKALDRLEEGSKLTSPRARMEHERKQLFATSRIRDVGLLCATDKVTALSCSRRRAKGAVRRGAALD